MDLEILAQHAMEIRQQYAKFEREKYGRSWTKEEIAMGFVGDVGDLAKLAMAMEGVRAIPDARQRLAHELADCLWSILVLSQLHDIDLEQAFLQTMEQLEEDIVAAAANHNIPNEPTAPSGPQDLVRSDSR